MKMELSVSIVLIGLYVFAYEGGSCTAAILGSGYGARRTHHQQLEERRNQPDITVTISTPAIQNFDVGDRIQLPCKAYHNIKHLSLAVFWSKESGSLPEGSFQLDGVLMIDNAQDFDSGVYVCRAQIDGRFKQRTTIIVGKRPSIQWRSPPVIEPLDEMYTVVQGTDFNVTCNAFGNPYPTIEWKKIHGGLGSNCKQIGNSLTIHNAQMANRGIYQCIAISNGGSTEFSTVIEIEPREAPVVEVYPREPQTVRIGESAMLSCRAIAGIPSPTVAWSRKDGAPLSRNIEEKYQGTILISDITFADAGQYECKASNIAGESSLTATINVQQAPEIHISPNVTELTLTEGDELRLNCFAQGSPSPAIHWIEPSGFEASHGTIHKYNIGRRDEGTYICHAKNDAGEDQKYITISIEQKRGDVDSRRPDSGRQDIGGPKQLTTIVGYSTNISCHTNHPNLTRWRRQDGQPLPSNSRLSGNNLIIHHTEKDAAGIYECILHGNFRVEVVEIIVVEIPKITLIPEKPISVRYGDNFNISCNASGDEPISISWHTKNHTPFPADVLSKGEYLEFSNITQNNAGTYYCTASNPYADVTKTVKILPDVDS